jgi:uroporphyrinogen decarboxylase
LKSPLENYSHRSRLEKCLSGSLPDRAPVALWRHFPVDDQSPHQLAAATAAFQHTFDFDLIKVSPSSSFCIRDWGAVDEWRGNPEGTRDYGKRVIKNPDDWEKLPVLEPQAGALGDQLTCLNLLVKEFSPKTPVIQTIFSPLSQAKNLIGPAELLVHLRKWPDAVHKGLQTIAETTLRFLEAARKTGIDGIFYAVQHAQYGILSETEFIEFEKHYDLPLLASAKGLWLNMVHLHGQNVMFNAVADYPAGILNWHDREGDPSLAKALEQFQGVLCGGLRQWETMVLGTPDKVIAEAREAIQATGGKRFILGTGCVTPTTAPYGNLLAARHAVD